MTAVAIDRMTFEDFPAAAERAASFVLDENMVPSWKEGAIFPCEMAFFLAACECAGVTGVIESGRQDGYSTEILGRWAAQSKATVVSIDLEHDAERAARCRQRLRSLPVELIRGNAYSEIGRQVNRLKSRPLALLVDGPKGWPALSLLAAAADTDVKVAAVHNLAHWVPERPWFISRGGRFYEDMLPQPGPRWRELRELERREAQKLNPLRSLEISSLGVLVFDENTRERFRSSWDRRFGLHQPAIVRLLWSLGMRSLTPKLYGLSYRLFG